ncbi:MAG: hypothetical protein Q7S06_02630 [Nanoarchaeota archaeon]|nr:hypothetical protein [Nanoarchaeota archaeon]
MQDVIKALIGIGALVLGYFIGNILAVKTKEELFQGKKWFKIIVFFSLVGGVIGLILRNDVIMFSFFFMAIVTSRSLMRK